MSEEFLIDLSEDPNFWRIQKEVKEKLERLRDEFAMAALTGLLNSINGRNLESPPSELASKVAYLYADAMLKEREINHDAK